MSRTKLTKKRNKRNKRKTIQKGGAAAAARGNDGISKNEIPEIDESSFDGTWEFPIISQFSPAKQQTTQEAQRQQIDKFIAKYRANEHIMWSLKLMLQREHLHSNGEWQVFYHSYADAHILFDVQTAIYELIYDLEPDVNRVILRLFNKEDFIGVNINSIKSQLGNMSETSNRKTNRDKNIRKLLLSAVCSLFIRIYKQNFTDIFVYGYTCNDINYTEILTNIFVFCGINRADAIILIKTILSSEYIDEITRKFYEDHTCARRKESSSNGQLLQIFVKKIYT
jgi:hypothetical protein